MPAFWQTHSQTKNTKRESSLKDLAVFHRIFLQALLERQDTKIEIQKNMPALRVAYFQKKTFKNKIITKIQL